MVSWGTTTNVWFPTQARSVIFRESPPISLGALGGYIVEAGLSAAGAALGWLERVTGRPRELLLTQAAASPPGANGVVALPWLHGARAPWWQPDAHAAFAGLTSASGPGELARAVVESVAFDVDRCLELVAPGATELAVAGGGVKSQLWREVLAATTGRPLVRRAVHDAASVGARLLVGAATGSPVELDQINPVVVREEPDADLCDRYRGSRQDSDRFARAMLDLTSSWVGNQEGRQLAPGDVHVGPTPHEQKYRVGTQATLDGFVYLEQVLRPRRSAIRCQRSSTIVPGLPTPPLDLRLPDTQAA